MFFFCSSRRRHTRCYRDWSSDVCSSDLLRLEQQLITEALPALETDTARVPVLAVEAIAPESGQFNWKDYYARALVALNEPLLDRKVIVNAAVNPDAVRPTIRR